MTEQEWVRYVNRHLNPTHDLPRLTILRLRKWARYGLLLPTIQGYSEQDMERTMSLLRLEQQISHRQK